MRNRALACALVALSGCGGSDGAGKSTTGTSGATTTGTTGGTTTGGTTTGGTTTGGTTTGGTTGGPTVQLGHDILIYRGAGGVPASSHYNNFVFDLWSKLLTDRTVTDGDSWPADLSDLGLVMLVGPGANGPGLSDAQVAQVTTWVNDGGTLLVVTDVVALGLEPADTYINSLLPSMGVHIGIDVAHEYVGRFQLTLPPGDPLGNGAGPLHCETTSSLTFQSPARELDQGTVAPIQAVQTMGKGRVMVLADISCLSDYENGETSAWAPGMIQFVRNLSGK